MFYSWHVLEIWLCHLKRDVLLRSGVMWGCSEEDPMSFSVVKHSSWSIVRKFYMKPQPKLQGHGRSLEAFLVPGTNRKKLSQIIDVPFGYWTWRPERLRLEDVEVWLKPCVLEVCVKRLLFDAVCSFSLRGSCKERSLGVREALVTIHWNLPWCSSSVEVWKFRSLQLFRGNCLFYRVNGVGIICGVGISMLHWRNQRASSSNQHHIVCGTGGLEHCVLVIVK